MDIRQGLPIDPNWVAECYRKNPSGDSLDVATEIRRLTEVVERLQTFYVESATREIETLNSIAAVLEVVVSGGKP